MKIKKFPQSCLMITKGVTKLLIDPGNMKFEERFLEEWKTATAILISHRHGDHCYTDKIKDLGIPIYTTAEVAANQLALKVERIIKEGDKLKFGKLEVEVVKAVHGFAPVMRESKGEIFECVGFMFRDGKSTMYFTSDTIAFNNNFEVDYIFAPACGNCVALDGVGAALYAKMVKAKKLFVIHMDNTAHVFNIKEIKKVLKEKEVDFKILECGQQVKL